MKTKQKKQLHRNAAAKALKHFRPQTFPNKKKNFEFEDDEDFYVECCKEED